MSNKNDKTQGIIPETEGHRELTSVVHYESSHDCIHPLANQSEQRDDHGIH